MVAPHGFGVVVMADVYATVDDVKARWPDMPPGSEAHAAVMLEDASALMRAECPTLDEADETVLRLVCVDLVKSAMQVPELGGGVSSVNLGAGPFSQQVSYSNPAGDLYLTKKHKRLLGCGRQRAFTVDLIGARDVP